MVPPQPRIEYWFPAETKRYKRWTELTVEKGKRSVVSGKYRELIAQSTPHNHVEHGYVIKTPPCMFEASGNASKFTAGALSFGYFPLGEQRKVTRVQGAAPAHGITTSKI
jgi:hypothetical protein